MSRRLGLISAVAVKAFVIAVIVSVSSDDAVKPEQLLLHHLETLEEHGDLAYGFSSLNPVAE